MLIDDPITRSKSQGPALMKTDLMLHRYNLIKSRLTRLKQANDLTTVDALKNSKENLSLKREKMSILFGIVTKDFASENNQSDCSSIFKLEDETGEINIDLTGCDFLKGCYFIENLFYIARGFFDHSTENFQVAQLALPPIESNEMLRNVIGAVNLFGTPSKKCAAVNSHLKSIEKSRKDVFFVFLNELWLDDLHTINLFEKMLQGFISSQMIPAAIICTGNFSKNQYLNEIIALENYKINFTNFARKISELYPEMNNTRFIFVPGSKDPGAMNYFAPRFALHSSIAKECKKHLPNNNFYFESNPCRFQYCTQEIIVSKLDLSRLLEDLSFEYEFQSKRQNSENHKRRTKKEQIQDLINTVQSQANISPLPIDVQPILMGSTNSLNMYNLPDLLIYGQGAMNIKQFYSGGVASPGSFGARGLFQVYFPATREMQESERAKKN